MNARLASALVGLSFLGLGACGDDPAGHGDTIDVVDATVLPYHLDDGTACLAIDISVNEPFTCTLEVTGKGIHSRPADLDVVPQQGNYWSVVAQPCFGKANLFGTVVSLDTADGRHLEYRNIFDR